jgi:glycosyltransferase involved in cell wall biosynthesis
MAYEAIRVLQALTKSEVGGTELMVLRLVRGVDRTRFACEVSFLDGCGPMASRFQAESVPVHDLHGPGGFLGAARRLAALLKRRHFHIVHLYGFRMSLLGRVTARVVSPRPLIVHGIRGLHITEGEETDRLPTQLALAVERLGAPWIDSYIANSQGAAAFLTTSGIPGKKFTVIPNGIDLEEWSVTNRQATTRVPTIICVANFRPRKRHQDLLESLDLLHQQGMQIHCQLVGDGVTRSAIAERVRQQQLNGIVEFMGSRTPHEVRQLLHAADIFALPSLWEGMPGSVMEAMAAGLPVVGTDVAGTQELVVDGVTGYLVSAKNPQQFATRLQRLLVNPGLRTQMGEAGRKRIQEHFSLTAMVRQHEEVYTRFVQERLQEA